jgi:hypothetical protein
MTKKTPTAAGREKLMDGWLIRISGWEGQGPIRLFAAAETDPRAALVAVQNATNDAPKRRVETVGQLSPQTFRRLRLKPGQVLDLSP